MIPVPSGVRVWLAVGRTDMRRGMNGLALQVQEALGRDPHAGDLYVFRGVRGDLIKPAFPVCGRPPPRKVFCSALIRSLAPICPACLRART
jgi:transposase